MSKHRWQKLTEQQQLLIRRAAKASVPYMREQWDKRVDMSRQKVMEAGVKIIENPDLSYFSDAMTPVYEQFVISEKMRYLLKRIQETKVGSDS